jgi:hypothetical protein
MSRRARTFRWLVLFRTAQIEVDLLAGRGIEGEDRLVAARRRELPGGAGDPRKVTRGDAMLAGKGNDIRMLAHAS